MLNLKTALSQDKEMEAEIMHILESGDNLPAAKRFGISHKAVKKAMIGPKNELPQAEAMIMMHMRPSLLIQNNKIQKPDSAELRKRLVPLLKRLETRVPSVGRIDIKKSNRIYGGTGWMITEDIIITNRHVAELFAEKKGKSIVFKKNSIGDVMEAYIDFKEEYVDATISPKQFEVKLEKILYVAANNKTSPDIAFLKMSKSPHLPSPIPMSTTNLNTNQFISVIGYPAYDPGGITSKTDAQKVFNGIYEVKRFSPGHVTTFANNDWYFMHDCTTLGGNSGSVVLDNNTGLAVGLHFMGEVGKENYAVKSTEILKALKKVNVTIAVSQLKPNNAQDDKEIDETKLEAPKESYNDRTGYQVDFLGKKYKVAMPTVVANKTKVLSFEMNGKKQNILHYHHFSVMMNKERRMCIFSICNIDGLQSKRGVKRSTWKLDSRIPVELQIIKECYGNPPKFSRGHMTRKEDPIWGELSVAKAAGDDTFHVTNAVPQMQPFNAPIWLGLEDYALQNARQDEMKITVITGPIFDKSDPQKHGVRIPVEFFKIIAFIHDDTGKLCATGYIISQEESLSDNEFVFGEYESHQVPIKSIEKRTGVKFANLASVDPLKGQETSHSIASFEDIVFV